MDTRTFYLACLERCQIILSTSILSCACRILTLLTIYLMNLPKVLPRRGDHATFGIHVGRRDLRCITRRNRPNCIHS